MQQNRVQGLPAHLVSRLNFQIPESFSVSCLNSSVRYRLADYFTNILNATKFNYASVLFLKVTVRTLTRDGVLSREERAAPRSGRRHRRGDPRTARAPQPSRVVLHGGLDGEGAVKVCLGETKMLWLVIS